MMNNEQNQNVECQNVEEQKYLQRVTFELSAKCFSRI